VAACWPLLAQRLGLFERHGMRSLAECWVVLWLAAALGRWVQWWAR
jgi:hypothetical protein